MDLLETHPEFGWHDPEICILDGIKERGRRAVAFSLLSPRTVSSMPFLPAMPIMDGTLYKLWPDIKFYSKY